MLITNENLDEVHQVAEENVYKKQYDEFIDWLSERLRPRTTDEPAIKIEIEKLLNIEDANEELQRQFDKKEQEYIREIKEYQNRLKKVEGSILRLQDQLSNLVECKDEIKDDLMDTLEYHREQKELESIIKDE